MLPCCTLFGVRREARPGCAAGTNTPAPGTLCPRPQPTSCAHAATRLRVQQEACPLDNPPPSRPCAEEMRGSCPYHQQGGPTVLQWIAAPLRDDTTRFRRRGRHPASHRPKQRHPQAPGRRAAARVQPHMQNGAPRRALTHVTRSYTRQHKHTSVSLPLPPYSHPASRRARDPLPKSPPSPPRHSVLPC